MLNSFQHLEEILNVLLGDLSPEKIDTLDQVNQLVFKYFGLYTYFYFEVRIDDSGVLILKHDKRNIDSEEARLSFESDHEIFRLDDQSKLFETNLSANSVNFAEEKSPSFRISIKERMGKAIIQLFVETILEMADPQPDNSLNTYRVFIKVNYQPHAGYNLIQRKMKVVELVRKELNTFSTRYTSNLGKIRYQEDNELIKSSIKYLEGKKSQYPINNKVFEALITSLVSLQFDLQKKKASLSLKLSLTMDQLILLYQELQKRAFLDDRTTMDGFTKVFSTHDIKLLDSSDKSLRITWLRRLPSFKYFIHSLILNRLAPSSFKIAIIQSGLFWHYYGKNLPINKPDHVYRRSEATIPNQDRTAIDKVVRSILA
jgi:hypothetical protein